MPLMMMMMTAESFVGQSNVSVTTASGCVVVLAHAPSEAKELHSKHLISKHLAQFSWLTRQENFLIALNVVTVCMLGKYIYIYI